MRKEYLMKALWRLSPIIPSRLYVSLMYRLNMGIWPDLKHPTTFNEKLQWLKLYNRKPEYTMMVDKVEVKKYVADIIGEEYVIPTLGVWDNPDDIDFDSLPNQFVLKCNHNSGLGICICRDKNKLNIEETRKELHMGLKQNYYKYWREWPYKNVKRKILAEKFMTDDSQKESLNDYKMMCFDGKVYCSFVCSDRYNQDGLKVTFYDREWNKMPFQRHYPSSEKPIQIPTQYHKMIQLAEELSKGIPFVRVDFYEIKERLYFGELTFYPGSGLEEFNPEEWDERLGRLIKIPHNNF